MSERKSFNSNLRTRLKGFGVAVVYLYGSEALGVASRLSDLDVGVVFERPDLLREREERARLRFELSQCLEPILVERGDREIDLVFLQTASPVLQFEAIHAGSPLFVADPIFKADYEATVIRDYLDIRPLVETHYQAALDRIG